MLKLVKIAFVCAAFVFSAVPAMADSVHGVFRVVKGDVKVKSAKNNAVKPARLGDKVFPKDTIITGKDSRAKVVMTDNNEINVSPDTQLVFSNYEYKPTEGKKDVILDVIYGKVRSKVNQKYENTQTNKFQIRTPSAVAGVRGTDLTISNIRPPGGGRAISKAFCTEGKFDWGGRGSGWQIKNPVAVAAGTFSTFNPAKGAAEAPEVITSQVANNELKGTNADKPNEVPTAAVNPMPGAGPDAREPSSNEPKNDQPKTEAQPNGQPQGSNGTAPSPTAGPAAPPAPAAGDRQPSSVGAPVPAMGAMFDASRDLPTGSVAAPPVINIPGGNILPPRVNTQNPDVLKNCPGCKDAVSGGGAARVKVRVVNSP